MVGFSFFLFRVKVINNYFRIVSPVVEFLVHVNSIPLDRLKWLCSNRYFWFIIEPIILQHIITFSLFFNFNNLSLIYVLQLWTRWAVKMSFSNNYSAKGALFKKRVTYYNIWIYQLLSPPNDENPGISLLQNLLFFKLNKKVRAKKCSRSLFCFK